ncbi:MAG TPA: aldose 1-epimerase family protein [Acidimicrobiales bacterium]|nr:aldose 1-epimerase family protein [Acidimicrobiales bacterium]
MRQTPEPEAAETAPSGRQFAIGDGDAEAIVTEVGASLRAFTVGSEAIVWGYGVAAMSSGGRGQILAPWPNRLEDGTYEFAGVTAHAALDEPERNNAIHGLVRWLRWDTREHSAQRVVLSCELAPQPAYPWRLALEMSYEVTAGELVVGARAENRSATPAPFGMGAHPYLDAGAFGADGCTLSLPADRRLLLDERGLPRGSSPVEGSGYDFRSGRPLAGVRLDDCFTELQSTRDGQVPEDSAWHAMLTREDGRRSVLWADSAWPYVMCYTGDTLPGEDRRRGVAVEPMTCPPNALRSGQSVVTLAPGRRWSGRFGIRSADGEHGRGLA